MNNVKTLKKYQQRRNPNVLVVVKNKQQTKSRVQPSMISIFMNVHILLMFCMLIVRFLIFQSDHRVRAVKTTVQLITETNVTNKYDSKLWLFSVRSHLCNKLANSSGVEFLHRQKRFQSTTVRLVMKVIGFSRKWLLINMVSNFIKTNQLFPLW